MLNSVFRYANECRIRECRVSEDAGYIVQAVGCMVQSV